MLLFSAFFGELHKTTLSFRQIFCNNFNFFCLAFIPPPPPSGFLLRRWRIHPYRIARVTVCQVGICSLVRSVVHFSLCCNDSMGYYMTKPDVDLLKSKPIIFPSSFF